MSVFTDTIRRDLLAAKASNVYVDAFAVLDYQPTPKQQLFHDATEYDVLFGGAAGGGKSKALLMQGVKWCSEYPGIRGGVFRRSYKELEKSLFVELQRIGYCKQLGAVWNGTRRDLTFPNKSVLEFGYLENMADASRYLSVEYQFELFDELTLLLPDAVELVASRLRSGSDDVPVLGRRSASNPGGVGHGAAKGRYIDPTGYGEKTYVDVRGREVRFIPSKLDDNPHINTEYARDLDGLPEAMRKAYRDGSWDAFAGQFFTEWDRDLHVVPPFDLPAGWRRYAGIDWGYAAPWAVLWVALDEDGRAWVYDELYATKVGESEQARRILAAEERHGVDSLRYGDDAMWTTRGEAKSVALVYGDNDCWLMPAKKGERLSGWQRVRSFLANGPACRFHREQGLTECPMLHVLDGRAPNLVRTIPNLPFDTLKVEDIDTKAEDHAADALRYVLINLGQPSVDGWLEPETPTPSEDTAAAFLDPMAKAPEHWLNDDEFADWQEATGTWV